MFIYDKDMERVMQEKKREVIRELETHKERLLKELSAVDKTTLTRLRQVLDDYNKIQTNIDKVTKENVSAILECEKKVSACNEAMKGWDNIIKECEETVNACDERVITWDRNIKECLDTVQANNEVVGTCVDNVNACMETVNLFDERIENATSKKRYIIIGDSEFNGYRNSNGETVLPWVHYFRTYMRVDDDDVFVNSGSSLSLYSYSGNKTYQMLLEELDEQINDKTSVTDIIIISDTYDFQYDEEKTPKAFSDLMTYVNNHYPKALIHLYSVGVNATAMKGNSDSLLTHGVAMKNYYTKQSGRIDFKVLRGWAIKRENCEFTNLTNGKTLPNNKGAVILAESIISSLNGWRNSLKIEMVDFNLSYFDKQSVKGYVIDDGEKITIKVPAQFLTPTVENPTGLLAGNSLAVLSIPSYVGYLIPANYSFAQEGMGKGVITIDGSTHYFDLRYIVGNSIQKGNATANTGDFYVSFKFINCPVSKWVNGSFNFSEILVEIPYNY